MRGKAIILVIIMGNLMGSACRGNWIPFNLPIQDGQQDNAAEEEEELILPEEEIRLSEEQDDEIVMEELEISRSDEDQSPFVSPDEDEEMEGNDLPMEEDPLPGGDDNMPVNEASYFIYLRMRVDGTFAGSDAISDQLTYKGETTKFEIRGWEVSGIVGGEYLQELSTSMCEVESIVDVNYTIQGFFNDECNLELLFEPLMDIENGILDRTCTDSSLDYSGWGIPNVYLYFPLNEMIEIEFSEQGHAVASGEKDIGGDLVPYHWIWKVGLIAEEPLHFEIPVKTSSGEMIGCMVNISTETDPDLSWIEGETEQQ